MAARGGVSSEDEESDARFREAAGSAQVALQARVAPGGGANAGTSGAAAKSGGEEPQLRPAQIAARKRFLARMTEELEFVEGLWDVRTPKRARADDGKATSMSSRAARGVINSSQNAASRAEKGADESLRDVDAALRTTSANASKSERKSKEEEGEEEAAKKKKKEREREKAASKQKGGRDSNEKTSGCVGDGAAALPAAGHGQAKGNERASKHTTRPSSQGDAVLRSSGGGGASDSDSTSS